MQKPAGIAPGGLGGKAYGRVRPANLQRLALIARHGRGYVELGARCWQPLRGLTRLCTRFGRRGSVTFPGPPAPAGSSAWASPQCS